MTLADTITNYAGGSSRDAAMDEEAFKVIYDRTARPLWAYLRRVSGRADVADDLLQETYCRFFVRNPRGLDEAQTRSYLFRIATNLLHDRWRRGGEQAMHDQAIYGHAIDDEPMPDLPTLAGDEAARMDVQRAMQRMKPRERQLLWLAYVEGMSHAEIAATTGLSALSIRLLLFRARRRAASMLLPGGPANQGTLSTMEKK
ncbi:RNA polymerase sigma-70 factor (ECF subfamily) [Silvibacterium bohemicum]|uniref:RNA polymerase sigma-70 factor (ECF subfamily) n=1 Tax=Silvibacterium bohemicum TaxID=1577686 RepID=A0A841JPT9_9BACT|nr:RNA polymerase sigma factor [Silvibacterium bohemicum]MBB6143343.1 RNA polymerase sigma-70 factor (ECF subfamily) [Silvibacterium bohemicum]